MSRTRGRPRASTARCDVELRLRGRMRALLKACHEAGYWPQLMVGKPAPPRQTIVEKDVYLKPHDRSDELTCSCCGRQYEDQMRSRVRPVVTNWCIGCRELLHEMSREAAMALHQARRRGRAELIARSEARVEAHYAATGAKLANWSPQPLEAT